ncbi:MAG: hypothetical protein HRT73_07185 [Flavobacteriales bacterium]|nr:hypothetical protein [Flavobacteriales bacterium]
MRTLNIVLVSSLILLFSCSKNSDRDLDTTINSSEDFASAQSIIYDAFKIVHQAANSSKGITTINLTDTSSLFGCDTLIVDTTSTPMSITVQFNGTCNERSGAIYATFNSKYDILGSLVNITFNNYTYRSFQIGTGTISYSYSGLNGTLPVYSYNINNIKIISPNNKTMSFSGSQRVAINTGATTAVVTDDNYTITGSASGSTYRGNEYTATFTKDLVLSGSCNWISSGTVTINPENKPGRILDFGSSCDEKATVNVNSIEQEITIP